jgi:hypothetical protein
MPIIREVLCGTLCRPSYGEIRRSEAEKTCWRHACGFCGEDIVAICFDSRSVYVSLCGSHSYDDVIAYEPLSKQKAPKVLADALLWVNSALTEFGIAGLSLRALIEFLKMALQNSNAAVRTSATKVLVTLKLFAGSSQ